MYRTAKRDGVIYYTSVSSQSGLKGGVVEHPLAPLHNPSNLMGIEVARAIFPNSPQAAVFDTAFHQTIRMESYLAVAALGREF